MDPPFSYDGHMKLQTFSIVESGEEILTVPGLFHAALAWIENPEARQVYRIARAGWTQCVGANRRGVRVRVAGCPSSPLLEGSAKIESIFVRR